MLINREPSGAKAKEGFFFMINFIYSLYHQVARKA